MDKSWITKPQSSIAYQQGIKEFINFAFKGAKENDVVICPCKCCGFRKSKSMSEMFDHLMWSPFPKGYTMWIHHGESFDLPSTISPSTTPNMVEDAIIVEDCIQNMIDDAFGVDRNHANDIPSASNLETDEEDYVMKNATQERKKAKEYYELAREGEQPLYEGCRQYSRLSFLVKLYHIKCLCGLSEKAMTMILELIKDAFEYANIPSSFYEAKKSITKHGLNYVKIPACSNGCMLYWEEDEDTESCKTCNTSKWKIDEEVRVNKKMKKIPAKVLRYFPLKPRLQRLFLSSKTTEDMRWHATDTNNDGMLRHPRDSETWKKFESTHTWFSSDLRNVRLALASDGFNPFGVMSANNSIWPVVLIPYNTPQWVCMKQTSFIMSMIIPGKEAPGNNIDVYLQPLVKELKDLWTNVLSYDGFTVPMFKCEWANTTNPRGIKIDKLGFTSINFARLLHTREHEDNEPYIQASEAQMVFYVDDESEQGWSIPVHLKPRDLYDMGGNYEIMTPIEPYPSQNLEQIFSNANPGTSAENDADN